MSARAPRLGLGRDAVEPDRARFVSTAQLIEYLCDHLRLGQSELAARCGLDRAQITRWIRGDAEPTLRRLRAVLEPLGWTPAIILRPSDEMLDGWLDRPLELHRLLGYYVLDLLAAVAQAAADGLDVVVGGEVAAVLQGVPLSTRRMTVTVREEHGEAFRQLVRGARLWVGHPTRHHSDADQADGDDPHEVIESGPVAARLVLSAARPPTRLVRVEHFGQAGRDVPVIALDALLNLDYDDPAGLGPAASDAAGRFGDRVGRRANRRPD